MRWCGESTDPSKRSSVAGGLASCRQPWGCLCICWVGVLHLRRVIICPQPISRLDQTIHPHTGYNRRDFFSFTSKCKREVFIMRCVYVWMCLCILFFFLSLLPLWFSTIQDICVMNCRNLTNLFLKVFPKHTVKCLWLYYHIWILDWEHLPVLH